MSVKAMKRRKDGDVQRAEIDGEERRKEKNLRLARPLLPIEITLFQLQYRTQ